MKRIVILLAFILTVCHVSAQTLDSIAHHIMGDYGPAIMSQWESGAQLRDGSILFNHCVGINGGSIVVGNVFYKISRHGAMVLDTLFIEDSDPPFYTFAKNPDNDDNHIRLGIVRDSSSGGSFLQILTFDNNLHFDFSNEVFVPLSDTFAYDPLHAFLITKQNDLALTYMTRDGVMKQHFACFGLDGTPKHDNDIPSSSLMLKTVSGWGIFNESPLEYYAYGKYVKQNGTQVLNCYVFDSLFQPKENFTINPINQHFYFKYNFGWMDCLIVDGEDFIIGSRYMQGTRNGVCVVRYDKRTREEKDIAFFESKPMINNSDFGACPVGLGLDPEGSVYLSYNTQNPLSTDKGQIAVVKMDADFNVQWERFCLEPEGYYKQAGLMTILDDGGAAVCGTYLGTHDLFFLILSDDGWAVTETKVQVRPYVYYPNPVLDELHLQYSPDVTPSQIELYDLQGRLVRTQKNGLERLEMNGLSVGTYTMRVTLEGGKVFSDKVVKE